MGRLTWRFLSCAAGLAFIAGWTSAAAQTGRSLEGAREIEALSAARAFEPEALTSFQRTVEAERAKPSETARPAIPGQRVVITAGTQGPQSLDAAISRLNARVGYPLVTDFGRKLDLGDALTMEDIIRRREQTQVPSSPDVGAGMFNELAKRLLAQCGGSAAGCGQLSGVQGSITSLQAGIAASPNCGNAADAYLVYYPRTSAPKAVRAAYDVACLGSFEPRAQGGGFTADTPPAIFKPGPQSALAAVGLLEVDETPVCGGLLRNDGTFVTARHCFEGATGQAWKDGRVRVRPADGRAQPWAIASSFDRVGAPSSPAVGHDWAVVKLVAPAPIGAPASELRLDQAVGEVTLLGYFRDHTAASYGPGASADNWRKGLRWPRPGFCQAYREEDPDCVKLLCQTVQGFSGTPVFQAAAPAAGQPLQVVGFISRPSISPDAACGAEEVYVTAAAAARAARP